MILVTESAKEELKRMSAELLDQEGSTLRLVANQEGQLGLVADNERDGDQLVEHQGGTILVVGRELSLALEGLGLDCQDSGDGPHLILVRHDAQDPAGADQGS